MTDNKLYKKIEKVVEEKIKPSVQMDGGDIELVEVIEAEGLVRVRLLGACLGCMLAPITLHLGVEKELKKIFPQIKKVEMID